MADVFLFSRLYGILDASIVFTRGMVFCPSRDFISSLDIRYDGSYEKSYLKHKIPTQKNPRYTYPWACTWVFYFLFDVDGIYLGKNVVFWEPLAVECRICLLASICLGILFFK